MISMQWRGGSLNLIKGRLNAIFAAIPSQGNVAAIYRGTALPSLLSIDEAALFLAQIFSQGTAQPSLFTGQLSHPYVLST